MKNTLYITSSLTKQGIRIKVLEKIFDIQYPKAVWQLIPKSIREILKENVTYGYTHFLPLMLKKDRIVYDHALPFFESLLFKNQLYDVLDNEKEDRAPQLSYLKKFYNLDIEFANYTTTLPNREEIPHYKTLTDIAVLPFSFGKESLVTCALCLELGIKPILVYFEEPSHKYEKSYKLKQFQKFQKEFNIPIHFVPCKPSLFRYGAAFNRKRSTEIGWGNQTTLLALMCIPFVFYYKARYILFGSEHDNNAYTIKNGWKIFYSYDQTSRFTPHQSLMTRLLTQDQCEVKSMVEPIEEITAFYILNNRYPRMQQFLFSCDGKYPLHENSPWCHRCRKCLRVYIYSVVCGIDPKALGFREDILKSKQFFSFYMEDVDNNDMIFSLHVLFKKGHRFYKDAFIQKNILPRFRSWKFYRSHYCNPQPFLNLPQTYEKRIMSIFKEELQNFSKLIPV